MANPQSRAPNPTDAPGGPSAVHEAVKTLDQQMGEVFSRLGGAAFGVPEQIADVKRFGRTLPVDYMPSVEKEREAEVQGWSLDIRIHATPSDVVIALHPDISDFIKEAYRNIRRKRGSLSVMRGHYQAVREEVLRAAVTHLPQDIRDVVGNDQFGVHAVTIQNRSVRTAPRSSSRNDHVRGRAELLEESLLSEEVLGDVESVMDVSTDSLVEFIDGIEPVEEGDSPQSSTSGTERTPAQLPERVHRPLTVLQELRLALGRAKRLNTPESWDKVVDVYIRAMDEVPAFLTHRIGISDMLSRVKRGEIESYPKRVLSLGSGPYGEALALRDYANRFYEEGIEPPEIYNVDFTFRMLSEGRRVYHEREAERDDEFGEIIPDVHSIVGDMEQIPAQDGSFDMVQASSIDNLRKGPMPFEMTLREMARVLKPGGVLSITNRLRLPDEFYALLTELGFRVLTKPHTKLRPYRAGGPTRLHQVSPALAAQLERRIGRETEYIIAVKERAAKSPFETMLPELAAASSEEEDLATQRSIEGVLRLIEEKPKKAAVIARKRRLIQDLILSLKIDLSNTVALKRGKVIVPIGRLLSEIEHARQGSGAEYETAVRYTRTAVSYREGILRSLISSSNWEQLRQDYFPISA